MEISASQEKYSYFQNGEMVFLISHQSDQLIEMPIEPLIQWSNKLAEKLDLKVIRCQERELRFPGTLGLAKPKKQEVTFPDGLGYVSPKLRSRGAFSLIPVEVRGEMDPETNTEGAIAASKL